ncbi:MAG: SDR family oxidoreductase, partial [Candidatus Cloacimonadaceae bacterium]|nr:SDR family oxidoreductase [Candidatus Cloacimonadaceae bacterium]
MIDKLYIITGANGQMGSYLVEKFAPDPTIQMLLLYNNRIDRIEKLLDSMRQKNLLQTADSYADITEPGISPILKSCDLADYNKTKEIIENVLIQYSSQKIYLAHTASIRSYDARPLSDGDPDLWLEIFTKNVKTAYNMLRILLPHMRARAFGRIVMFGSNVTKWGLKNGSAYAAAKTAMVNLVKSCSLEN